MNKREKFMALFFTLLMTACNSRIERKPTEIPVTDNVVSTNTSRPIPPTINPTPPREIPTRTLTPIPSCPDINPDVLPGFSHESIRDYRDSVLSYLISGGNPEKILSSIPNEIFSGQIGSVVLDMTGDGLEEVVVAVSGFDIPENPGGGVTDGKAYVFQCGDATYEIAKTFDLGFIQFVLSLESVELFNSLPPQLIISNGLVSWSDNFQIIGWDGRHWKTYFEGTIGGMGIPGELIFSDEDNDGTMEIVMSGSTAASSGGGIYRGEQRFYLWDGEKYSYEYYELLPSPYLIHHLEDAQILLDQGDILGAVEIYGNAVNNTRLKIWPTSYERITDQQNQARDYQTSFALFRASVLWLSLDQEDKATQFKNQLISKYPAGKPGSEFIEALEIYAAKIAEGETQSSACRAVTTFLNSNYPDLKDHFKGWGAANIFYDTDDLCPF